jgi:hypothetical protein
MRRTLLVLLSSVVGCALLAMPVLARGGGGGHGGGGGGHAGGGGGHGGGMRGGSAGFRGGSSGGAFRGGFRGSYGFRGRSGFRGFYGYYGWPYYYPGLYAGYYDPFFWNSGYVDPYYNGYGDPGYAYAAPAPEPAPPVILQQTPSPAVREYPPAPQALQAQKYEDPLYLLAMRDGTIRAVLAYWADGSSVHYVTLDHEQKQAPLTSIDRALSERLNRERNVTFRLPG